MGTIWEDPSHPQYDKAYADYWRRQRRNGVGWLPTDSGHAFAVLMALAIVVGVALALTASLH